jgi:hypothetical protein
MPATEFIEKALIEVGNANKALPTTTQLYIGLAKLCGKKKVKTGELEECKWTSYARTLWPITGTYKAPGEGEAIEPAEIEIPPFTIVCSLPASVTQGEAVFAFVADAAGIAEANVWYYTKLTAPAIITSATSEVAFAAKALKLTVI